MLKNVLFITLAIVATTSARLSAPKANEIERRATSEEEIELQCASHNLCSDCFQDAGCTFHFNAVTNTNQCIAKKQCARNELKGGLCFPGNELTDTMMTCMGVGNPGAKKLQDDPLTILENVGLPNRPPPVNTPFPNLLGMSPEDAYTYLEITYNGYFDVELILDGQRLSKDTMINRVRLFVDKPVDGTIIKVPVVG